MSNPEDRYQQGGQQPPQFGQRSDQWSADSPAGQPSEPERPWPVYDPSAPPGTSGASGVPGAGQQQGSAAPGWGQPQVPPTGGPAYPAYGVPGGPQLPQQPGVAPANLPSRAGAIWTIVIGAVLAVIVAPAVFVGFIMGGMDWTSVVSGSASVTNGGSVTVDDSGVIAVVSQGTQTVTSCTLTSGSQVHELYEEAGSGLAVGRGIPAGTYTVDCNVSDGTALFVLRGDDLSGVIDATMTGMLWASIAGIAGVVAFIVGIVWLVRRNRQRRDVLRSQWGGPGAPGYYGR